MIHKHHPKRSRLKSVSSSTGAGSGSFFLGSSFFFGSSFFLASSFLCSSFLAAGAEAAPTEAPTDTLVSPLLIT